MPEAGHDDALRAGDGFSYSGLVLPVAVSVLLVSLVFFFRGGDATLELLTTALLTATVAGKFIVLRGLHADGFLDSPYKLAVLVVYLDVLVAFIALFNFGLLHRIPRLGRRLAGMQANGERILARNPWMRKLTFVGVVAFVMFPLSGTGAIGGALFGRLLGLARRRTLLAITLGAVLGGFGMAWLADVARHQLERLKDGPGLAIGGALVLALVGWRLWRNDRRARRLRAAPAAPAAPAGAAPDAPRAPAVPRPTGTEAVAPTPRPRAGEAAPRRPR